MGENYPTVGLPDLMVHRGHPAEFNGQKGTFNVWMGTSTAYFMPEGSEDPVILHPGDVIGLGQRPEYKSYAKRKFEPREGYDPKLPADAKKHLARMRADRIV